jgi:hypothetical protein
MSFGTKYNWYQSGPIDYNNDSRDMAIDHIRSFDYDMGGTNIMDPLRAAAKFPSGIF